MADLTVLRPDPHWPAFCEYVHGYLWVWRHQDFARISCVPEVILTPLILELIQRNEDVPAAPKEEISLTWIVRGPQVSTHNSPWLLSLGVLNLDFVMELGNEIIGKKKMGRQISINAGGHGSSRAIAAVRCGVPTALIGKVGDDAFGQQIQCTLEKEHVDCRFLTQVPSKRRRSKPTGQPCFVWGK